MDEDVELASFFYWKGEGNRRTRPLAWQNYDVIIVYVQSRVWSEKIYNVANPIAMRIYIESALKNDNENNIQVMISWSFLF